MAFDALILPSASQRFSVLKDTRIFAAAVRVLYVLFVFIFRSLARLSISNTHIAASDGQ